MLKATPIKRVLFVRRLMPVILALLGVFSFLYTNLHSPKLAYATASNTVNFQARLQNNSGAIAPDGYYNVEFKLYNDQGTSSNPGSCTSDCLWSEDYTGSNKIQVKDGYLSTALGSISPFGTGIDWSQQMYLTMDIGGTGGSASWDGEMTPRLALTATPYSFLAETATQAGELSTTSGSNTSTLSVQGSTHGNQTFLIQDQGASGTYYLLTTQSASNGFIQLQTGTPTQQTGELDISGSATVGSIITNALDTASAGTITVGGTHATAITFGNGSTNIATTINGTELIKPTSGHDSTTAFQIQPGSSSTSVLDVDTTNGRVGVDKNSPAYALDVNGVINSNTAVDVNGIQVCTTSCIPSSGSGNYIQNGTTVQTSANLFIRGVGGSAQTAQIQGANGQTGDLLDLETWNGTSSTNVVTFDSTGNLTASASASFKDATNSTTAFQVQNSNGINLFNADTVNSAISLGVSPFQSGYTTIGSNLNTGAANDIQMEKVTATSTGTLNSISVYFNSPDLAPNNKFQVALYADNSGNPGAKIASSSSDNTIAGAYAWNTASLSASITSGTVYWIGIEVNGPGDGVAFDSSGGTYRFFSTGTTYGTWPSTRVGVTADSSSSTRLSAYLNIDSSSANNYAFATDANGHVAIGTSVPSSLYQMYVAAPTPYQYGAYIQGETTVAAANGEAFNVINGSGGQILDVDTLHNRIDINSSDLGLTSTASLNVVSSNTDDVLNLTSTNYGNVELLQVTNKGAATFKSASNNSSAFQIQNSNGSSGILFAVDTSGNNVSVGATGSTALASTINIGTSTAAAQTINIGGTNSSSSVNILGGSNGASIDASSSGSINVGTSLASALWIGNNNSTTNTRITSGSTYENISGTGVAIKTNTNSADALDIQDASANDLLTASTINDSLNTQDINIGNAGNESGAGRLFTDSFESGSMGLWTITSSGTSTITNGTGTVRDGKYAAQVNMSGSGSALATSTTFGGQTTIDERAYVYVSSQGSNDINLMALGQSNTPGFSVYRANSTGYLDVYSVPVGTPYTSTTVLTTGTWHQIEMDITVSGTGSVSVYLDGTRIINQTNVNTGSNPLTQAFIGDSNGGRSAQYALDDMSIDTVRPGNSANLNVGDSLHVDGSASFGGQVNIQSTQNNTAAFQVQNASGANDVLVADTANVRVGVGTFSALSTLDVAGNEALGGNTQNLLLYSEQFDNAAWSVDANTSATANTTTAPNSTTTADTITATNGTNRIDQSATVTPSTTYTFSWYAKGGTMGTTKYSIFDATNSVDLVAATPYTVSGGWQRYSVTFTTGSTTTSVLVYPLRNSTATGTVIFWGAQLVTGSSPGTYTQSAGNTSSTGTTGLSIQGGVGVNSIGSNNILTLSQDGKAVVKVGANGATTFSNSTNSTTALQIQSASGVNMFTVDTSNAVIIIGSSSATNTTVTALLQLNSYNSFSDPATCTTTSNQGALYYSSNDTSGTNTIRGCINGSWQDIVSAGELGLELFGVMPDSPNAGTVGDLQGISGNNNSPCKVYWSATQQVTVAPCYAFSDGREVIVNSTNISTASIAASTYVNICLTGTGNQPALVGSGNATETSAGLPTWSAGAPILCLATVETSATPGNVGFIYDVRTFTNTTKTYATTNTAAALGWVVKQGSANQVAPTTGQTTHLTGIIVAYSGSISSSTVNAIIATAGPQWVKSTSSDANNNEVVGSSTPGYAAGIGSDVSTAYSSLGVATQTVSSSCTNSGNCQNSEFLNPMALR
jgi:hypothetical protein